MGEQKRAVSQTVSIELFVCKLYTDGEDSEPQRRTLRRP